MATQGHAAESEHQWWQRGVVYQIYPRSFQDTNGDGDGDLAGIAASLPYLADTLGVDALWLSPFYPSPLADGGYDVADHTDVDPRFGDLAAFDALVKQAHARELQIIVDYVPNHTSDQHRWFRASRSARASPYRDWYVWADAKPDGSPPNNWLSVFGGPAWEWDPATGQYYLHSFLKEQPDLNWRNTAVRSAMFDVLRFWLARGVDGFRLDAVHYIMKDPQLRDNPPNPATRGAFHKPLGAYDTQLHKHDKAHPDVHAVLRELRQLLVAHSVDGHPRVAIGEMHIYDPRELARYYGAALDELHLPFNFGLLGVDWDARAVRAHVDAYEAALPERAWPNYVLGNHDESRIASRIGAGPARVAMMLLLTLRGTPTLYYGDELGMHDVIVAPERVQDPWGRRAPELGLGRDPERTPMQWDASPNAGFCAAGVQPWLPLAADHERVNVAVQLQDPRSMLALTRRLLQARRASPALTVGSYHAVDVAPEDCFLYVREAGAQRFLVALSFSPTSRAIHVPHLGRARLKLSTHLDREGSVDLRAFELRANEGCLIELTD